MKKLLLFSALITLLAGCKKDEPYPKADYFYGKWRDTIDNLDLEFTQGGVVNSIYRNQGFTGSKIDVIGKGLWSFNEQTKNLKISIQTWTSPSLYDPLPGGPTIDSIVDRVEINSMYLTGAGYSAKLERIP